MVTLGLAACGDDEPAASSGGTAGGGTDAGTVAKADVVPVDPATVGSVSGVVRYDGPPVEVRTFNPLGEAFCIQHSNSAMRDDSLLVLHWYDDENDGEVTLGVRPLLWSPDGWPIAADPGFVPTDAVVTPDDVIGTWTLSQYQDSTPAAIGTPRQL